MTVNTAPATSIDINDLGALFAAYNNNVDGGSAPVIAGVGVTKLSPEAERSRTSGITEIRVSSAKDGVRLADYAHQPLSVVLDEICRKDNIDPGTISSVTVVYADEQETSESVNPATYIIDPSRHIGMVHAMQTAAENG